MRFLPSAWMAGVTAQWQRSEEERVARQLQQVLSAPNKLPPDLLVAVRVIEPIRYAERGQPARDTIAGEVVEVPGTLARSLAGLGRVEILR